MALKVVDRAMQVFGAEGVSSDQELARMWAGLRTLRYADVSTSRRERGKERKQSLKCGCCDQGPDEVHLQQIGKQELKRVPELIAKTETVKRREKGLGGVVKEDKSIVQKARL